MDPATIAAVAGGAGQLLSGLGFGSKTVKGPNLQEQSLAALGHERDSFNQKMQLAKQHGIHPLSVLGVPMATFTPAVTPDYQTGGADFSAIGSGIERISKSFVKPPEAPEPQPDPAALRIQDAQVRIAEAQAKKMEWDALGAQWRTEDLLRGAPGRPPALRMSNDAASLLPLAAAQAGVSPGMLRGNGVTMEQKISPPHPSLLGHSLGANQSFGRMVDSDGQLYSSPNPDVFQPDIEQYGTFHTLANRFGVHKALQIMAGLEQAPVVGGVLGALGAGAYGLYRYFGKQREEALRKRMHPRVIIRDKPSPYKPQWRGKGSD